MSKLLKNLKTNKAKRLKHDFLSGIFALLAALPFIITVTLMFSIFALAVIGMLLMVFFSKSLVIKGIGLILIILTLKYGNIK